MTQNKANDSRSIPRCDCPTCQEQPDGPVAREHHALKHLVAAANERSRRLFLGFLAQKYGRGGIALLSQITGLDRNTIARGRRELLHNDPATAGRVRRPGAGRKRVEANDPGF